VSKMSCASTTVLTTMLMSSFIFLVTVICYIHIFSITHSKRFQQVKSHFLGTFFYNTVVILVQTVVYF